MEQRNIKLTIAYDGFGYHGWQKQADRDTIQNQIEKAIRKLTGEEISVTGASRTDARVSAFGQTANFITSSPVPVGNFVKALNQLLPDEIAVVKAERVGIDFNSRFCAIKKQYRYIINTSSIRPIMKIHHCWHFPFELNVDEMQTGARYLIGKHDFKSFASSGDKREDSIRTIFDCKIVQNDSEIAVFVEGDGFLYNMVRNIVGTLVEIGKGRWQGDDMKDILTAKDRTKAGVLARPEGLALMWIKYPACQKHRLTGQCRNCPGQKQQ